MKISKSTKGTHLGPFTEEHRENMRKPKSIQARANMRLAQQRRHQVKDGA